MSGNGRLYQAVRVDGKQTFFSPHHVAGFTHLYHDDNGDFGFHYKGGKGNVHAGLFYVCIAARQGELREFDYRIWHPRDEQVCRLFPRFDPNLRTEVRTWLLVAKRLHISRDATLEIAAAIVNCRAVPPYRKQIIFDARQEAFFIPRDHPSAIRRTKKARAAGVVGSARDFFWHGREGFSILRKVAVRYSRGRRRFNCRVLYVRSGVGVAWI